MFVKAIALTATMIVASPAFAASQLERSLGVETGVYTALQLVELKSAFDNNDENRVKFILARGNQPLMAPVEASASGPITSTEQQVISNAMDDHDYNRERFVRNGGLRTNSSTFVN